MKTRPERRNAVKVLMFFDVGGSMDDHIKICRGAVLGGAGRVPASSNISISTTASTRGSGRTIAAATPR